ncbi:hypothetical protein GCM10010869_10730 [Mesorhizobium tianshanense]|nr:hypothetical protein GCM10010869_10730 [Mesorhizobium tianshanense]
MSPAPPNAADLGFGHADEQRIDSCHRGLSSTGESQLVKERQAIRTLIGGDVDHDQGDEHDNYAEAPTMPMMMMMTPIMLMLSLMLDAAYSLVIMPITALIMIASRQPSR